MPEKSWRCPDDYWADRDINGNGGNMYDGGIVGATSSSYGKVVNLSDFVRKSQLMNYEDKDGATRIGVTVNNSSAAIALMVHLQLFDNTTTKRILPAFSATIISTLFQAHRPR